MMTREELSAMLGISVTDLINSQKYSSCFLKDESFKVENENKCCDVMSWFLVTLGKIGANKYKYRFHQRFCEDFTKDKRN